jgi:hypothetical protein
LSNLGLYGSLSLADILDHLSPIAAGKRLPSGFNVVYKAAFVEKGTASRKPDVATTFFSSA